MTPFLQFRMWLRSAPAAERAGAAVVLAVVLALVAWAAVPGGGASSASVAALGGSGGAGSGGAGLPAAGPGGAGGSGTGPAAAGVPTGPGGGVAGGGPATVGAAQTGSVPGPTSGSAGPAPSGGCPAKLAPLKLGLPILDIAGPAVNSALNLPSPAEQQGDWQAIVDGLNAQGGIACHPLVADFQSMNPADNTSGHTVCLQYVQDHVFAVLGYLSANATPGTGGDLCVVQNHIPLFHPQAMPSDETQQYFPYLFGMERADILYRNFALGAKQLGQFDPAHGFRKLGIVYKDCQASLNQAMLADLHAAGLSDAQLDRYDLGCPSGYATPATLEQAVLQFKSDGVSTVTFDEPGDPDLPSFTRVARGQGWKPQYLLPDNGLLLDTDHNTSGPDPANFAGAVAVTPNQYGALDSVPPVAVSPATATCDRFLTARGLPTAEKSNGGVAGIDCDLAWMLVAAATHAPTLAGDQLAAGLQRARSVDFAYPGGPNTFSAQDSTTGGEFWRPVVFDGGCDCWKVTSADFRPAF